MRCWQQSDLRKDEIEGMPALSGFSITRFEYPRDRVIGDSQVRFDRVHLAALELHSDDGISGLGFFSSLAHELPGEAEMQRLFAAEPWPAISGRDPVALTHRLGRPRGGNRRGGPLNFAEAVEQAVWDTAGKRAGLSLWRLLGGTSPRVRAYASGLDFHLPDDAYARFFAAARKRGFDAFKIKVGHPDVAWDLRRLKLLAEVVGPGVTLMVDANEAWTPKEAIRRLHLYRDAGHAVFWVEDPVMRDDFEGLRQVAAAVPFCHVNTGEYLDLTGKRALIGARAVDILNCHGKIGDTMRAAWLAGEHGIAVSIGNTSLELGVHLAAALPECEWLEYSFQNTHVLAADPIIPDAGWASAPDVPGHGIILAADARASLRVAEPGAKTFSVGPPGPLDFGPTV